jgi:hypothetical protein
VTALGGTDKVTVSADNTTVTFKSGTTASVASGATVTVPSGVTLIVRNDTNGAAELNVNGTLVVKGTVETKSGLSLKAGGTISGNGTIKRGASSNAALLQITSSGNYTIEGVTLQGMAPSGSTTTNQYSVLDIQNGTVELTGVTIKGNTMTSGNGGGIYISGGTVTLDDCEVSDNLVIGSNLGGGIHISGGTVTLKGTTVSGNDTGGTGGGISINASGAALFIDEASEITENTSTSDGGGVWIGTSGGTVTLKGASVIKKNNGGNRGGGVFLGANGSNLILEGSGTAIYGKFETNGETSQSADLANTVGASGAGTALYKNAGSVKVGSTEVADDVYEDDGRAVDTTLLVSSGVLTNRK